MGWRLMGRMWEDGMEFNGMGWDRFPYRCVGELCLPIFPSVVQHHHLNECGECGRHVDFIITDCQ